MSPELCPSRGALLLDPQAVNLMVSRDPAPGPTASHLIPPSKALRPYLFYPNPSLKHGLPGTLPCPFLDGEGAWGREWEDDGGTGKKPFPQAGLRNGAFSIRIM